MLLKVIEDGIELPFEIDTGMDNERRWAQIWRGKKCVGHFESVDMAIDAIEEMIILEEIGIKYNENTRKEEA